MREVTVSASKKYVVHIGSGLLPQIGNFAAANAKHKKVAVISDSNVWPLYGNTVQNSLSDAGLEVCHYVFWERILNVGIIRYIVGRLF